MVNYSNLMKINFNVKNFWRCKDVATANQLIRQQQNDYNEHGILISIRAYEIKDYIIVENISRTLNQNLSYDITLALHDIYGNEKYDMELTPMGDMYLFEIEEFQSENKLVVFSVLRETDAVPALKMIAGDPLVPIFCDF